MDEIRLRLSEHDMKAIELLAKNNPQFAGKGSSLIKIALNFYLQHHQSTDDKLDKIIGLVGGIEERGKNE